MYLKYLGYHCDIIITHVIPVARATEIEYILDFWSLTYDSLHSFATLMASWY